MSSWAGIHYVQVPGGGWSRKGAREREKYKERTLNPIKNENSGEHLGERKESERAL